MIVWHLRMIRLTNENDPTDKSFEFQSLQSLQVKLKPSTYPLNFGYVALDFLLFVRIRASLSALTFYGSSQKSILFQFFFFLFLYIPLIDWKRILTISFVLKKKYVISIFFFFVHTLS